MPVYLCGSIFLLLYKCRLGMWTSRTKVWCFAFWQGQALTRTKIETGPMATVSGIPWVNLTHSLLPFKLWLSGNIWTIIYDRDFCFFLDPWPLQAICNPPLFPRKHVDSYIHPNMAHHQGLADNRVKAAQFPHQGSSNFCGMVTVSLRWWSLIFIEKFLYYVTRV